VASPASEHIGGTYFDGAAFYMVLPEQARPPSYPSQPTFA
jgi:hypothetical protein